MFYCGSTGIDDVILGLRAFDAVGRSSHWSRDAATVRPANATTAESPRSKCSADSSFPCEPVLEAPEAYAKQALEVKQRHWHAYKLHPPGDYEFDLKAYRLCREAVGSDFKLMADPVAAYNHEQALRMGRELERLNYYWLEEPLFDVDFNGLRKLSAQLDIPICGTEVLVGSHYSTAECIATGVVDIVRTDVSWKGGVTAVMKTAHLAESYGVQCELHTTIYHPLEIVNLHCCCAISNCEFFELLYPLSHLDFGMKNQINIDPEGFAHPPETPGIGVDFDWDFIDKCTIQQL